MKSNSISTTCEADRLWVLRGSDYMAYTKERDAASDEVIAQLDKIINRVERRNRRGLPLAGRSETIMANRITRRRSFGMAEPHASDNRYPYGGNR